MSRVRPPINLCRIVNNSIPGYRNIHKPRHLSREVVCDPNPTRIQGYEAGQFQSDQSRLLIRLSIRPTLRACRKLTSSTTASKKVPYFISSSKDMYSA